MKKMILSRLLQFIPVMIGVTFITFFLMYISPSDPVSVMLSEAGMAISEESIAQIKSELGLDRPFLVQYLHWLSGLLRGDFGKSLVSNMTVGEKLIKALPASFYLMCSSMLLTLVISIPLGIFLAVHKDGPADYFVRFLTFIGTALPSFTAAIFLIYFFAVRLKWVPVLAAYSLKGLILPSVTLAIAMSSKYIRQIRAAVLDELAQPYVVGIRARGVAENQILYRNVLKNVMVTVVTLTGLSMGSLIGGTVVIESIFAWPGMGKLVMDSIKARDYITVQGFVVCMAFAYVFINLLTDVAYAVLDPKIRKNC